MTAREPISRWVETDDVLNEYQLLRAAKDAAMEPWALLEAVRDPGGRVVDFTYHDINPVAARQQRRRPEDLVGRSVAETLPEVARTGLIDQYAHCVETGDPLILDDLPYHGRTLDGPERETHRYEMRGVRVSTPSAPIGVFEDTEFTSCAYHVPAGCRILIYSDGASEVAIADGRQLTGVAFNDLVSRVAASPDWSLDELIDKLRTLTPSGAFEDDCSLIQIRFD